MVDREFANRFLQEIDIALQAGGAPLHGLFDGADFDAGNILRGGALRVRVQAAVSSNAARAIRPIMKSSLDAPAAVNLLRADLREPTIT